MEKRRVIKSLENLPPSIREEFDQKYDRGYGDNIRRIQNAKGEIFFAVPFETEDILYMVKVAVPQVSNDEEDNDLSEDEDDKNLTDLSYDDNNEEDD